MSLIDLLLAERTIGVINPSGSATATEMSASAKRRMLWVASSNCMLTSGTAISAMAQALTSISLTEILTPGTSLLISLRNAKSRSRSRSTVKRKWGACCLDICKRPAIARRMLDIGNVSKAVADVACGAPAWGSPSSSKAAASTSSRLTRPSEPLLRQSCRLIPSLLARRRAKGVADTWLSSVCDRGALPERTGGGGEAIRPPAATIALSRSATEIRSPRPLPWTFFKSTPNRAD